MSKINYQDMPHEAVATPICDFCSSPKIKWDYPTQTFVVNEVKYVSQQDWAACEICSNLIETNNRRKLAERSYETSAAVKAKNDPFLRELVIHEIEQLHDRFYNNRTGPRKPV